MTTRAALDELAGRQITGPVPGLGGGLWRLLWDAAREFIAAQNGVFPPAEGDPCPLCLQSVGAEAAARLAHFDAHVTGSVRRAAEEAAARFTDALAACAVERAQACRTPLLDALRDRDRPLVALVDTFLSRVEAHLAGMHASPLTAQPAAISADEPVAALTAWSTARNAHAQTLLAAEDPGQLAQVTAELAELEAQCRLSGDVDRFLAWRNRLRTVAALDRAHSALATNRITTAQRELTDSEVGKALDTALSAELQRLSCTHLPVQLTAQTAHAETKVGLTLAPHAAAVSDIVSEGERRALALAFFFAELAVIGGGDGIVVDDPVSSLDDARRRYIADRLVAEASRRQVIVFTHELAFLLDLQEQAVDAGVPMTVQGMWRYGNDVGRVSGDLPFTAMKLKARVGQLKERVARWDADPPPAKHDEASQRVTQFYSDLRIAWERAVEERLFQGVVQRFQRGIKTQSLRHITFSADLVARIDEGMTRTSMFVHDQAPGAIVPLPDRAQLSRDLELLVSFEKDVPVK